MARPDEASSRRPERIVILDADDPMVEIQGQIVWQEEHDHIVEETWQAAYAEGYDAGIRDAAATPQRLSVEFRRRRPLVRRIVITILIAGFLVLLLMLPLVIQNALR